MDPLVLIQLQIRLEYQLDDSGLLVSYPGSSEQALYVIYRYDGGYVSFFNRQLPENLRQDLQNKGPDTAFSEPESVDALIGKAAQHGAGGGDIFWSGYFDRCPGADEFPNVELEHDRWVIKVKGQVISQAISIRQNQHCREVYVETHPGFRGRGYARQVVAAWANQAIKNNQVALYSHKVGNIASAALACSLGITWYADVVAYE